jgi:SAM-dependent methyltransferase
MYQKLPSAWVRRFVPLIRAGGRVLDLAAGGGRNTTLLLDMGFAVTAIDRDIAALQPFAGARCEVREFDLETVDPGATWDALGGGYDGIVVANYLHRPLFAGIAAALARGGMLIYETFAAGNETVGKPSRPDFLLRPGELLQACQALRIVAYEDGFLDAPARFVQRIAAVRPADGEPLARYPLQRSS